ncbi:DUF938 domain-containing protein [Neptuniibacter sp.]|uniref:DUF938 domain-containing protein n=1 Tax=Neptuniibacter sp. TaxID=1962643 RepID=UPI0026169004|nr:DUF938 domain-containing protein [Neptuniibacter sp.]MCP4595083.1 DUF938 domain-containing protein [Neptuniibacter sp.]
MQPYSGPADRNKEPILEVISDILMASKRVLEVGSGTGQHALYFSEQMPHLTWLPSDFAEGYDVLRAQFEQNSRTNVAAPIELDVRNIPWDSCLTDHVIDLVYTANTLHIMSWAAVETFFAGIEQVLGKEGFLVVYGPFKYNGDFTTPSNAQFDQWLKNRDPVSGVRDFEAVNALAESIGLVLQNDCAMPANNQCLIWRRSL